ncbi:MAG: hypothetical protein Fur0037_00080 [Planctomycetota bacterium]
MLRIRELAIVTALLLPCSCKTPATNPGGDGVTAIQFPDAVVPDGLTLHDRYHESSSAEAPGWRHGHFVYTGQTHLDDACAHLRSRMPQHGWTLTSEDRPDEATRRMAFSRGRYRADYYLHRKDGITEMVIDYRTVSPTK